MQYLKIRNSGELDVRLISLMGGTTKSGNAFKIGRFGTGLKYVFAYLFRNNIDLKIFVGEKEVKLHTETESIQETDFTIVYIDGQRSSITTQMGMDWTAWMIIREIWCNALDEGGHSKEVTDEVGGSIGTTTFYIQVTSEIKEVLDNWKNYFIHEEAPMYDCKQFAIYAGGKSLRLYKQGVLIHEQEDAHALFSYDIKNASINELREYKGITSLDIFECLTRADHQIAEYVLCNLTDQHWEGRELDYDWSGRPYSEGWKSALGNARVIHQDAVNTIQARGLEVDLEATIVIPKNLFKSITKQFTGISTLRVADKIGEFYEIHDEKLQARLKQAITILEKCDYLISPELKFIFGIFGDKNIFAKISFDKKEVLISEQMRDKSIFEFCTMLVEENGHFATGFDDCSRAFQQYWINLFVKTMMEKHEVVL